MTLEHMGGKSKKCVKKEQHFRFSALFGGVSATRLYPEWYDRMIQFKVFARPRTV